MSAAAAGCASIASTPAIQGRVLQVSYDLKPGLVALNVGSEQGVKRGMTFQIFSGSTWKGQVRVENVQPGMSSALITDMTAGQTIAQGDDPRVHGQALWHRVPRLPAAARRGARGA